jgi:molybdopterin-guanine dinucleotide biosynthesis protein A
MRRGELPAVGGYVLAGGNSSRMGRDKALLELGGKPLVLHAVTKLRRLCNEVSILGNNPELETHAPLVRDLHKGCGPMAGIEAALLSSKHEWNLILPVDVPFLPTRLLDDWLWSVLREPVGEIKLSMLAVDDVRHPTLLIIHREITPYLTTSLERGDFKLLPALRLAVEDIAARRRVKVKKVFAEMQWDDPWAPKAIAKKEAWYSPSETQRKNWPLWFANLNTPEEFVEAEKHLDALDTSMG